MTTEQLKQTRDAMTAFLEGKPVQFSISNSLWQDCGNEEPGWELRHTLYRPKPTPSTVPWSKPQHVPLNCWLRNPLQLEMEMFVTSVSTGGVAINDARAVFKMPWASLEHYEYSTDRKQWFPCTIEASEP